MSLKFLLSLSLLFLFVPHFFAQIEGPNPIPDSATQPEPQNPPPQMEEDDYYEKFQELITEFDQSMENMNPDDIITFTLKQGLEEVKIWQKAIYFRFNRFAWKTFMIFLKTTLQLSEVCISLSRQKKMISNLELKKYFKF